MKEPKSQPLLTREQKPAEVGSVISSMADNQISPRDGKVSRRQYASFVKSSDDYRGLPRLWRSWTENSAVYGVDKVFSVDLALPCRIVWALLVILGFLLTVLLIYWRIAEYVQFEAVTRITIEPLEQIQFPAVTVCNFNLFESDIRRSDATNDLLKKIVNFRGEKERNTKKIKERSKEKQKPGKTKKPNMNKTKKPNMIKSSTATPIIDLSSLARNSSTEKPKALTTKKPRPNRNKRQATEPILSNLVQDHGWKIRVHECIFAGRTCNESDFIPLVTEQGLCYQFNPREENSYQYLPGMNRGFQLLTSINYGAYSSQFVDEADWMTWMYGLIISIHEKSMPPLIDSDGIACPPGGMCFLSLKQIDFEEMPPPYGKCNEEQTSKYFGKYTRRICQYECQMDFIVSSCRCMPWYYSGYFNHSTEYSPCTWIQMVDCILDKEKEFNRHFRKACVENCPVACSERSYETSYRFSPLPSKVSKDVLENHFATSALSENFVFINVYFNDISQTIYSVQEAESIQELLSDLAGDLGVFLGLTVISFFELVEFLVVYVGSRVKSFGRRRSKPYEADTEMSPDESRPKSGNKSASNSNSNTPKSGRQSRIANANQISIS